MPFEGERWAIILYATGTGYEQTPALARVFLKELGYKLPLATFKEEKETQEQQKLAKRAVRGEEAGTHIADYKCIYIYIHISLILWVEHLEYLRAFWKSKWQLCVCFVRCPTSLVDIYPPKQKGKQMRWNQTMVAVAQKDPLQKHLRPRSVGTKRVNLSLLILFLHAAFTDRKKRYFLLFVYTQIIERHSCLHLPLLVPDRWTPC